MKAIFGLGNPGLKFSNTRHNVGFLFLDYLSLTADCRQNSWKNNSRVHASFTKIEINKISLFLVKPQMYMNRSGDAVRAFRLYYDISILDILVVHDDLDLEFGTIKLQYNKGPKIHNGLISIQKALNTSEFYRLRIGVDNRKGSAVKGQDYVLGKFLRFEKNRLKSIFASAANEIRYKWLAAEQTIDKN